MSSLVRRFITASSKDQSSNKPLFKQIGPILKHFKQCQCQPVKFFFSLRFDLSWETSDWRQANSVWGEPDEIRRDNPTIHFTFPSPPLHTHTHKTNPRTQKKAQTGYSGIPTWNIYSPRNIWSFHQFLFPSHGSLKPVKKRKSSERKRQICDTFKILMVSYVAGGFFVGITVCLR